MKAEIKPRCTATGGSRHKTRLFTVLKPVIFTVLVLLAFGFTAASAQGFNAGVAANFMLPFEELSRLFEEKTGVRIKATYTSTGNLYAQIRHGAPYGIFLAADEIRPAVLHEQGRGETPFVYARGRVVLWSAQKQLLGLKTWEDVVRSASLARVAVANPETAPYGTVACEALKRSGLWETVKPKLVFAQTVAQAFQFAHTLSVDAGFCALSAALSNHGKRGRYWPVPQAPGIVQAAIVLEKGRDDPAVNTFAEFLVSEEARAVKEKYGYE